MGPGADEKFEKRASWRGQKQFEKWDLKSVRILRDRL